MSAYEIKRIAGLPPGEKMRRLSVIIQRDTGACLRHVGEAVIECGNIETMDATVRMSPVVYGPGSTALQSVVSMMLESVRKITAALIAGTDCRGNVRAAGYVVGDAYELLRVAAANGEVTPTERLSDSEVYLDIGKTMARCESMMQFAKSATLAALDIVRRTSDYKPELSAEFRQALSKLV